MFAVVYRWTILPGRESAFERDWRDATIEIAATQGGWGSRLHRGAEAGVYLAYAQWPDRATWQAASASQSTAPDAAGRGATPAAGLSGDFEIVFAGDVCADLLQPRQA
jgi:heme-degrading monooxygenase HmoA